MRKLGQAVENMWIGILPSADLSSAFNLKKKKGRKITVLLVLTVHKYMRISYNCLKLQLLRTYKCGFTVMENTDFGKA